MQGLRVTDKQIAIVGQQLPEFLDDLDLGLGIEIDEPVAAKDKIEGALPRPLSQ